MKDFLARTVSFFRVVAIFIKEFLDQITSPLWSLESEADEVPQTRTLAELRHKYGSVDTLHALGISTPSNHHSHIQPSGSSDELRLKQTDSFDSTEDLISPSHVLRRSPHINSTIRSTNHDQGSHQLHHVPDGDIIRHDNGDPPNKDDAAFRAAYVDAIKTQFFYLGNISLSMYSAHWLVLVPVALFDQRTLRHQCIPWVLTNQPITRRFQVLALEHRCRCSPCPSC